MKVAFDFSVYSFLGCNIKKELKNLETAMYQEFTVASKEPIYDPLKLKLFCISSGAPRLFDAILDAMTDPSHSSVRIELNKKRTVAMLYQLCYGLSQKCNWYQCDHAVFLKDCHLNQQGLSAERLVGSTCNRQKTNEILHHLLSGNTRSINELISEAISHKWQLVLMIDDYTTVHTKRRPDTGKPSAAKSMCTIILKVFKNIQAVSSFNPLTFHNPEAIDVTLLVNTVSGSSAMHKLACTYSSIMPSWIRSSFFDPELERSRLETHTYCDSESVKTMRQMKDVNLVDFVELTLKSKEDFDCALDIMLQSNLVDYLKYFLLPQPGDWPAQFYTRQIVYETLQKFYHKNCTKTVTSTTDHSYHMTSAAAHSSYVPVNLNSSPPSILSLIPGIGPLHVSLNGSETLFNDFQPFFTNIDEQLFPKSKLAKHPKPWRISMILETVYGGWLHIRDSVKEKFKQSRGIEYRTLLNLLDNYLPLVLSIYSVSFKLNNFCEYFEAMIRVWVMFTCLQRHHYNKAPLIWLAMVTYWRNNNPELYQLIWKNLVIVDEYPVENEHSIIRSKTNDHDSAEKMQETARATFQSRQAQSNFRNYFAAKHYSMFSQKHINNLKLRCAKLLAVCFSNRAKFSNNVCFTGTGKNKTVTLPNVFGKGQMKLKVLPLGYASENQPNPNKRCDFPGCLVSSDKKWRVFEGCAHSFHLECLGEMDICPFCQSFLQNKARSLAETAKSAILHPKKQASTKQDKQPNEDVNDQSDDDEIETDNIAEIPNVEREIKFINERIKSLPAVNPPSPCHLIIFNSYISHTWTNNDHTSHNWTNSLDRMATTRNTFSVNSLWC